MEINKLKRLVVGNPLTSEMQHGERIPNWKALAVLSSDALSSVAYATEEILIPLSALSVAAMVWSIPIALAIGALLLIITISYRQTIDSYPNGGGAYTVASENLGTTAGLIAAASLLIDYTLTVSVSVASGVENIASAFPFISDHREFICTIVILLIMTLNLRGVRESANIFALPTYIFIFSILIMVGVGLFRIAHGDFAPSVIALPHVYPAIPMFLILRAFSSGCSALTGVEAITNSISIFKDPTQGNAKATMAWMAITLGVMFLGLTMIAHFLGIVPSDTETTISLVSHKIFGNSVMYFTVQVSTALILFLAANTAYADFPRLASLLAKDRFLPRQLTSLGDRLVFSNGIIGLSIFACFLIYLFNADTHHLIPLYAVGVFLSFTLSQSGMVIHHLKYKEGHWKKSLIFNAIGAVTTAVILLVIATTKFMHGAWMVIILIPAMVFFFYQIQHHYNSIAKQLAFSNDNLPKRTHFKTHITVVPISGLHQGVLDAIEYAISISGEVKAVYVEMNEEATTRLRTQWGLLVPEVPLIAVPSPYRSIITPILDYIKQLEKNSPDAVITIIIPEFITSKWYHQFLHNQTALILRTALKLRKGRVITSIRYHLK